MLHVPRFGLLLVAIACAAPIAAAQTASQGHLSTGHMVDRPNGQFAFDPSTINAQRGDTVRFVQQSSAPHNVSFRTHPKDAKLGDAAVGPYVLNNGQTYDLVIDARFPDGTYTFACDPHESVGMKGTLVIGTHK